MPQCRKRKADETSIGTFRKIIPIINTQKLDATLPVLYVEHCRSCIDVRRRAIQLHQDLLLSDLKLQLQLNAGGRERNGSFDISISHQPASPDKRKLLWSWNKTIPRASKWPNMEKLMQEIIEYLKLTDAKNSDENEATNAADEEQNQKI